MSAGTIFDIQHYSIHDGPGIRTTVFLKGCPLHCLWCSNPESQNAFPEIMYDRSRCTACGRCVEVCPRGANLKDGQKVEFKRHLCQACGACVEVCPHEARQLAGKKVTVEDILKEVEKDRLFYENSGGGITLSGGEPMSQPDFVQQLLKECKARNIHTVLDTCGYAPLPHWDLVLDYVDLVLFDLKQMNPEKHEEYTGVSNELILAGARKLASHKVPLVLRIPLIPGYNDTEHLESCARFAREIGASTIELLPFHRLCLSKYEKLDKEWKCGGISSPTRDVLKNSQKVFAGYGLTCRF